MKRAILIASSALVAAIAAAPASAESLTVNGTIAPYCNVALANTSSNTVSVAMANTQTVANLKLSCNAASGTKLIVRSQNGDLVQQIGSVAHRINYDLILSSPSDSSFDIAAHDTFPSSSYVENVNQFTRSNSGYTQDVANGIPLVMSLNLNVAADTNNTASSRNYAANAAPAGNYSEVFSFTASAV